MALDRQSIEKKDFAIGRRGYEPEAVDEHLRQIASEVEALRRSVASGAGAGQARAAASLAASASEQVRAIVEAAETTAADIRDDAEREAREMRDEAQRDAEQARADAGQRAREHVARVSESTAIMLQRVDAMETELGALVESLRTGANRLTADLALLQGNVGELREGVGGRAPAVELPVPEAPVFPGEEELEEEELLLEAGPIEQEPELAAPAAGGGDVEGARLIALNMALNGTPREETDRYLAENFDLDDRQGLLDEVYASVG